MKSSQRPKKVRYSKSTVVFVFAFTASAFVLYDVLVERRQKVFVKQLVHLVSTISSMYNKNDFHNFDHASHVTQSVSKLLSCMVSPDVIDYEQMRYSRRIGGKGKHDFSRCIASDPFVQFAVVFSAIIHDVDHPGVPNATLVKESHEMATAYHNKSCAEQNSVDLAWNLLMQPTYEDLRRCLYNSQEELERLRQLIVNCVMATDVPYTRETLGRPCVVIIVLVINDSYDSHGT